MLKPNSLCVSFYGWNRVDSFFSAWKGAGFMPVGHIVFNKTYASSQRFLRYSRESAYVLAKGRPELPANPLTDVQPWHYSGNHNHPTEKSVDTIRPIIEAFTKAGDVVLDPFAGSGSSLVAAALLRRQYIGIELEQKYCEHARRRLDGVMRHLAIPRQEPRREEGARRAGLSQGGLNGKAKGLALGAIKRSRDRDSSEQLSAPGEHRVHGIVVILTALIPDPKPEQIPSDENHPEPSDGQKLRGELAARLLWFWQFSYQFFGGLLIDFIFYLWWAWQRFRIKIVPKISKAFAVVAAVEVAVLLIELMKIIFDARHLNGEPSVISWLHAEIHCIGRTLALSRPQWLELATIPVTLGGITVWHHHRVVRRLDQQSALLGSLRDITVAAFSQQSKKTLDESVASAVNILTHKLAEIKQYREPWVSWRWWLGLKHTLGGFRRRMWHSTEMKRDTTILAIREGEQYFTAKKPWSSDFYEAQVKIPRGSAAGRALTYAKDQIGILQKGDEQRHFKGIIYIPWTRCSNGVRLKMPKYRESELSIGAFVDLKEDNLRSLICLEIPIHTLSNQRYVLCLNSNKTMCFGEIDFHAAHLVANVLGGLLSTSGGTQEVH